MNSVCPLPLYWFHYCMKCVKCSDRKAIFMYPDMDLITQIEFLCPINPLQTNSNFHKDTYKSVMMVHCIYLEVTSYKWCGDAVSSSAR